MKTIYLVRHGKAMSMDTDIPDFDRTLIERGENDAVVVAERLKKVEINPSLIITSPAVRALATARLFAKQLGYRSKSIRTRKALYYQEDEAILNVIHAIDDMYDSVMLVGHNPSFTYFAQASVKKFKEDIPTCGVIGINFKTDNWEGISPGKGKLKLYVYPAKVKKSFSIKSVKKDIETKITEQIENVLNELNINSTPRIKKLVREFSKEIAKISVKKIKSGKK